jgi:enoyl-CoA hydratase/long-chain 3-hydroxyacyl-CoA dehydrogenase
MHYFSPVDKIELLEIIRAEQTSDDTVCLAVDIGLKQGKIVIVVNDGPGFYTTRLLIFSSVEVFCLLQEGVSPKDIDEATKKFGFHVGLATLLDEFGIDIIAYVACHLRKIFGECLTDLSVIELFQIFVKKNLFGRKTRQGLYVYSDGNKKEINPQIKELLQHSPIQAKEM